MVEKQCQVEAVEVRIWVELLLLEELVVEVQVLIKMHQELQELPALIGAETTRLRAIIHNASDWVAEGGEVAPAPVFQRMMRVHAEAPYRLNLALTPLLLPPEALAAAWRRFRAWAPRSSAYSFEWGF